MEILTWIGYFAAYLVCGHVALFFLHLIIELYNKDIATPWELKKIYLKKVVQSQKIFKTKKGRLLLIELGAMISIPLLCIFTLGIMCFALISVFYRAYEFATEGG